MRLTRAAAASICGWRPACSCRISKAVVEEWAPDRPSNYRARFLAMPPDEALACILKGAGILSGAELAGERLTVPYETKEQEDEHSCFSDNTHADIVYDALGIQNVFLGRYVRVSGERIEGTRPSRSAGARRSGAGRARSAGRSRPASPPRGRCRRRSTGPFPEPMPRRAASPSSA